MPQDAVYVTVAVPLATPATTPPDEIVATVDGLHDHVPPATELPSVRVLPGHTGALPVMAPGTPFTVTTFSCVMQPVM